MYTTAYNQPVYTVDIHQQNVHDLSVVVEMHNSTSVITGGPQCQQCAVTV